MVSRRLVTALALDGGVSDEQRATYFIRELGRELRRKLNDADATRYEIATPLDQNWQGLARYWRKRGQ